MLRQFLASTLFASLALAASAQVVVYNNTTTFSGGSFSPAGATLISGNTITKLVADDLDLGVGNAGFAVQQYAVSFANNNGVQITARPRVRFYADNGGLPGAFLYGASFTPVTLNANSEIVFSSTVNVNGYFTVPASGKIWAGLVWDNNNGALNTLTTGQLDLLGLGIYNPPIVGSSTNTLFVTTAAGSFLVSNPVGSLANFGGSPIANLGWRISVVPEPSTYAALAGLLTLAVVALRRRSTKA